MTELQQVLHLLTSPEGRQKLTDFTPVEMSKEQLNELIETWENLKDGVVILHREDLVPALLWVNITPETLPHGREVLAGNFDERSSTYRKKKVGKIYLGSSVETDAPRFVCSDNFTSMMATHFIDLKPYDL